jgi:hypothetical protein
MSQAELEDATRAMVPVTEKALMERHRDIRIAGPCRLLDQLTSEQIADTEYR